MISIFASIFVFCVISAVGFIAYMFPIGYDIQYSMADMVMWTPLFFGGVIIYKVIIKEN